MTPYERMEQATKLFTLNDLEENDRIVKGFVGLVVPPSYIHPYGQAALFLEARITRYADDDFLFQANIISYDDSSLSVYAPKDKTADKALKRLNAFRELIEEYHPFLPPERETWDKWAINHGLTIDKN